MHQVHLISLFITAKNVTFIFHAVLLMLYFSCMSFFMPSKHQSYLFSHFETSKYVRWYLVCSFFTCKYVISAVFCSLTCNWSPSPMLLHFNLDKHDSHFAFIFLTTGYLFYSLFSGFYMLNTYTVPCMFVDAV